MNRRVLCFLTAAVLSLLPFCPALAACEHYTNGIVSGSDLVLSGYVAPQVGVPGYSGDFCCPICWAIAIRGQTLPALEPPTDHDPRTAPSDPAAGSSDPDPRVEPAAPAAQAGEKPSATKKPSGTKQNGPKATNPPTAPERTVFSSAYPYRRVRMTPEAGIRAEFAGERVWRGALSPFQSLFGN